MLHVVRNMRPEDTTVSSEASWYHKKSVSGANTEWRVDFERIPSNGTADGATE